MMKKSAILDVFRGFRGTSEMIKMPADENHYMEDVVDTCDELLQSLDPKQKNLYEKFIDAREDAFCEEVDNYYLEGFKLGLLIGIECMEE